MTYDPNIPVPTSSPSSSVSQIQTNFSQFASVFSSSSGGINYNHMPLNDFNQGKHAMMLFQNQTADPGTNGGLINVYAKNAAATTGGPQPQLFVQIPKFLPTKQDTMNAANTGMQLTYNKVNVAGPVYQSFLPGGYLLYFGQTTNIAVAITLSPAPTKILFTMANGCARIGSPLTPLKTSTNILSSTQFMIFSSGAPGGTTFTWMAIASA